MYQRRFAALIIMLAVTASGCNSLAGPTRSNVDFDGTWRGNYTVTGCTQGGLLILINVCQITGNSAPFEIRLIQEDDIVVADAKLGNTVFPKTGGELLTDGTLDFTSTNFSNGIIIVARFQIRQTAKNTISGIITQQWSSTGGIGDATITGTIANGTNK